MIETPPEYFQDFIEKAEAKIAKQVDGNGVDADHVKLKLKRYGHATFTAKTYYELDCKVDIKENIGKISKGEIISHGDLKTEIDKRLLEISSQSSFNETIEKLIKNLPQKGFGAKNEDLDLSYEKIVLTQYINCTRCRGEGFSNCQKCHGHGYIKCPRCYGRGEMQCDICLGHGTIQEGSHKKQCYKCFGKGEIFCTQCQGKRTVSCINCHAKGKIKCQNCKGHGVNSMIATILPYAKLRSEIHVQDLDNDPKRMVGSIGGDVLAQGGHIDISIVAHPSELVRENFMYDEAYQPENLKSVLYEANFPWGISDLELGGSHHDITFVGKKGAICESGKFMEHIIQPYLHKLDLARSGKNNIHEAIEEIKKFRVSRETFQMLSHKKPIAVMRKLNQNYPLGWSKNFIQTFVKISFDVLKLATRRSRYIGLATGLFIAVITNYSWFIMDFVKMNEISRLVFYVAQILPLVAGILITLGFIKIISYFEYRKIMQMIGSKSRKAPPMGKAGLYAIIGNLLLWAGLMIYTFFSA